VKSVPYLFFAVAAALLVPASVSAQSSLTDGLVAWYPLEGNTADVSGHNFHGTASGSCWYIADRFDAANHALFITNDPWSSDADTGRIDIPEETLNGLTCGTIAVWIKPADITFTDIIAKQYDGVDSLAVFSIGTYASSSGGPAFGEPGVLYFHPQNSIPFAMSSATVTNGIWQHVAVVFDTNACVFYINGIRCGTNPGDYSVPAASFVTATSIGCWRGDGWYGSYGSQLSTCGFDDVRIYDRTLSDEEINLLYQDQSVITPGNPRLDIGKAVYVKFSGLNIGYTYQLQVSTDLVHWTNHGQPFGALSGTVTNQEFFSVDNWDQLYFRLQ